MRRIVFGIALPVLLLMDPSYVSSEPTPAVPPLESYDARIRDRGNEGEHPAQPLPQEMTVCADRVAKRCWTEAGVTSCPTTEGNGEVFAVVTVSESDSESARRLEKCWSEMRSPAE